MYTIQSADRHIYVMSIYICIQSVHNGNLYHKRTKRIVDHIEFPNNVNNLISHQADFEICFVCKSLYILLVPQVLFKLIFCIVVRGKVVCLIYGDAISVI